MLTFNHNFATKCDFKSKTWFDIGKLLHTLSEGSEDGYKLWIMYSTSDEKFEEPICYNCWDKLEWFTFNDFSVDNEVYSLEPVDFPDGW